MDEPSNADILDGIKTLRIETGTRIETLSRESRERDKAQTEDRVRLESKLERSVAALTTGLSNVSTDLSRVRESVIPEIAKTAAEAFRKATASSDHFDALETSNRDQWKIVLERFDRADLERREEERLKKEAREIKEAQAELERQEKEARLEGDRKKESVAFFRVQETARLQNERQKIWAPVWQAVAVAVITGIVSYAAVNAGHQNSDAKTDAVQRSVDSLTKKVSSLQAPDTFSPAAAVPMRLPEPPPAVASPRIVK